MLEVGVLSKDRSLLALSEEFALLLEDNWFIIEAEEDSCLLPEELIGFARRKLGNVLALGDDKIFSNSLSFLDSLMCSSRLASWSNTDDFESKFLKMSVGSLSVELFNCTVEKLLAVV